MQQKINVAALFAAHFKSPVKVERLSSLKQTHSIHQSRIEVIDLFETSHEADSYCFDFCELALKPLSTITDEHLEMIARMALAPYAAKIGKVLKIEHELFADGNIECKIWFKKPKTYFCLNVNHVTFLLVKEGGEVDAVASQVALIDTLRLLGYDCGYMHIPSLIEDGRYAVDITKLQTK